MRRRFQNDKKRVTFGIALILGFTSLAVSAHDHWILWSSAAHDDGTPTLEIGSGHRFPVSDTRLSERLLTETRVTPPNGEPQTLIFLADGHRWFADAPAFDPGVAIADFALQRPGQADPLHRGRALWVTGQDSPERYATGQGLELVPSLPLSSLSVGDYMPLRIHRDGIPTAGTVTITPANGRSIHLSTTAERPARWRVSDAGVVLATAAHDGQTVSLTFHIPLKNVKAP